MLKLDAIGGLPPQALRLGRKPFLRFDSMQRFHPPRLDEMFNASRQTSLRFVYCISAYQAV